MGRTFQEWLDDGGYPPAMMTYFQEHNIISAEEGVRITGYDSSCEKAVVIPSRLSYTKFSNATLNTNMTSEELQACVQYTVDNGWGWDTGETAEAFCNGTGTRFGHTFQEALDNDGFSSEELTYFQEHNIISATQSTNTYRVAAIGSSAFYGNQLTSVVIPNGVTRIGDFAFGYNQLTSVEIPDSVTTIEEGAFSSNQLTSVTIGNSVTRIGASAFYGNQLTSVEIPNSLNNTLSEYCEPFYGIYGGTLIRGQESFYCEQGLS